MAEEKNLQEQLKIFTAFHKPSFVVAQPYLHPIQAGRATAAVKLEMQGDDEGDNISALNSRMCELTVLYNVWKNKKYLPAAYWGLAHYRRYFSSHIHWTRVKKKTVYYLQADKKNFDKVFTQKLQNTIAANLEPGTVILGIPVDLRIHTVKEHYCKDHEAAGWNIMRTTIEQLHPGYVKSFDDVGNQKLFYPYNMMIAHYSVWEKYLPWIFDIAFYINEHHSFSADTYQSRAIGFMAERLLTVYFHHHRNDYKIVNLPVAAFTKT